MLVLRTSNFQGQLSDRLFRDINTLLDLKLNFLPRASSTTNQTSIELFSTF